MHFSGLLINGVREILDSLVSRDNGTAGGTRRFCCVSLLHTAAMAMWVPLAHVGHWMWALYLPPILIVLGSILKTTISERRKGSSEADR